MEMMKERFAKLLLGEDMSGGGKGVSSALALSNAVTNLAGMLRSIYLFSFALKKKHVIMVFVDYLKCLFCVAMQPLCLVNNGV